ncbi:fumarylacetoacetate hydrolase family protein [Streptomyces sp. NPDC091292]|uniref:fumarylacetoacetate hydrolase family protein n=1 Tax=Streptomyces sp. NPDC091292 TaxID=3365991 RepID=UPI0038296485
MKWATYDWNGSTRTGVLVGRELFALDTGLGIQDLIGLGPGVLAEAAREAHRGGVAADIGEVTLRPAVPRPGSVRDGACFLDHVRGCLRAIGNPGELPEVWDQVPAFYFANPATLFGGRDDVPVSPGAKWFDFEAEIGVVIGRPGRDLSPERAMDHVAGYTLFCDWTARDLQLRDIAQGIGQAKGKDGALTLGPYLVTPDELDPADIELRAFVNGTEIAHGSSRDMDWSFAELLSYISRGTPLRPGDVIGSGTIPGGCLLEHVDTSPGEYRGWLKAGDTVGLRSEQLGAIENRVVPGPEVHRLSTGH